MASTTPIYGWAVADLTDAPNGPGQMGSLAADIESTLDTAGVHDSGALTSGITITAASGWTLTHSRRLRNGTLFITLLATRTGGTITGPSNGNFGNTLVATLPVGYRPYARLSAHYSATSTSGGSLLDTDGTWTLTDCHPTATIVNGDNVRASFTFPI